MAKKDDENYNQGKAAAGGKTKTPKVSAFETFNTGDGRGDRWYNSTSSKNDPQTMKPVDPKDPTIIFANKKGGAVKTYAKGGSVKSSASKRGDGIAQKGKTRGKIC